MTRRQDDPTAVAQEIIDLIGGDTGLSRLRAAKVEALSDGLIFFTMTNGMTPEGVVFVRKVGPDHYRLYVVTLGKWVESRGADRVTGEGLRATLWKLIGKHEPTF